MKTAQQVERIYRIWSDRQQELIAVRIQYSVVDDGSSRVLVVGGREEWV